MKPRALPFIMNLALVGTSRCDVPARAVAGGTGHARTCQSRHTLRRWYAARTAQRAVPTRFWRLTRKISFRGVFTLVVAASLCAGFRASAADDPAAAFEAANKLYEQGKFAEATSAYEKIVQSGSVSAGLYFNLGNARFKSGEAGRAIASYRLAEALAPRDPDVRANLQFVRSQVQGPTQPPGRARRWLHTLTLNEWTVFASVMLWLWLLLLAWRQWQPALQRALRGLVLLAGGGVLIVGLCLSARLFLDSGPIVVVIAQDVAVRTGPLEDSRAAFTVHDGAELSVLDQKDDWLQVSAGGQWLGWLKRDQVVSLSRR